MRRYIFIAIILTLMLARAVRAEDKLFSSNLTVSVKEILPRQPFKVILEWKNISKEAQELSISSQAIFIYVAFGSGDYKRYRLFYPVTEEISEGISPEWDIHALLKPGDTHRVIRWVALARPENSTKWEFLFDESGKYKISLSPDGKDAVVITVEDAVSKEDKDAQKQFSAEAAELFLGDIFKAKQAESKLNTIVIRYPNSLYSPYAAFALANFQWRKEGGFGLDFSLFSKRLSFIINKHPQSRQLLEDALYLMAKGFAFQKEGRKEALKYFSILQRQFPRSPYIDELQKDYGIGIEQAPPQISFKVPVRYCEDFNFRGFENISSAELRAVFEAYLRNISGKDYIKSVNFLAKDFMGDDGDKNARAKALQDIEPDINILKMEVFIDSSNPLKEYRRPATMPKGASRGWSGELIIIKGKLNLLLEDRINGDQLMQQDVAAEWVFRKEQIAILKGKWALISEILSNRNKR